MRSDQERSELDISLQRCAGEVPGGVRQVSVFPPLPGVTAAPSECSDGTDELDCPPQPGDHLRMKIFQSNFGKNISYELKIFEAR